MIDVEMSVFKRVQSQSEQQSAKNKEINERSLFEEAQKGNLVEVDRLLKTGRFTLLLKEWPFIQQLIDTLKAKENALVWK